MTTITLPSQLMDELNQVAANQAAPPEKLVEEAVRTYLRQLERKKIREEVKAFEMMHPKLVKQYLGQFIAVHNRQVVDHDEDFQMLHNRIRQRFGRQPVLLRQVTPTAERTLTIHSPRLERNPS